MAMVNLPVTIPTFYTAQASSITGTVSANTYVDVAGLSLVLPAGTYDMGFNVSVNLRKVSGGLGSIAGNIAITDASNNIVSGGLAFVQGVLQDGGISQFTSIANQRVRVTLTAETTYKLRIRCTEASSVADFRVFAGVITGSLTAPEVASVFYAEKVG
jgi:hypothetical protein